MIGANPMVNVEAPKIEKSLPDFLTREEIQKLFAVFEDSKSLELRDKTMFELLYSSGLRITEACQLALVDVDMENMILNIKGKAIDV